MYNYKYNIKVSKIKGGHGYVEGTIENKRWFAIVEDSHVNYAINPSTLEKGIGRVTRLCIYEEDTSFEGNPFLPSMTVKRHIYVNFQHSWSVLNTQHISMVKDLLHYLEMRSAFKVVV